MKYVSLLSGGKDSCFNLLHCAKNGHELVAAASLGPEPGKEELDSYMYQTVGQDAIEFVAQALDVPLYRRVIQGAAVEQGSEYGGRTSTSGIAGDETEDLYELLLEVKSNHPDIVGVSVGAILSNYQRVRVEHVCRRLSLVPLCYLWQRNQEELLAEMIDAGMHVVLIKVAGIGLTQKHLGKSLSEMREVLFELNSLYGSHICGEGGEYESLTLDCPLFKKKIHLDETEVVIHSDSDFAPVAYLRVKQAFLVDKSDVELSIHVPPMLDKPVAEYLGIEDDLTATSLPEHTWSDVRGASTTSTKRGPWVAVANIQTPRQPDGLTISDEVISCFDLLREQLSHWHLNLSHCVNINLFIASMDLFKEINAAYVTFFGTSPPARACVAVDLPKPYRIRIDCVAYSGKERQALHVQSLSYWAPANIGPYSQGVVADSRIFISGQIGMIPCDLSLPSPRSLIMETALCVQHANRIAVALSETSGGWTGYAQLIVFWLSDKKHFRTVAKMHTALAKDTEEHATVIYAAVKGIPKGALVEKQVLLHSGRFPVEDDGDMVVEERRIISGLISDNTLRWHMSHFVGGTSNCLIVALDSQSDLDQIEVLKTHQEWTDYLMRPLSIRLFYVVGHEETAHATSRALFVSSAPPITPIPCRFLADSSRRNCNIIMCILTA